MAATIRILISQEGVGSAAKDAAKDIEALGQTARASGSGFSSLREIGVGALREIGSLAVNALGQAASAIGGFLKDSISVAGDFEAGMNSFKAIVGDAVNTQGLSQFKDLFISLGKELPVSTSEVQQAAIEMIKGGIDPATVAAGGLRQAIQFAAAADLSLAEAAETSAKMLGGWVSQSATAAEKAAFLTSATDTLTKAANASTVDVHDLALGLYNVQGTAKTTGLSLQETTTALAELAPRFSNANTAGTSFRNFLVRLQPSTKPATDAMMALGLYTKETGSRFFDAQGHFVGVAQASQLLHDALGPLTDAERVQALQLMFGNDAMNAAAAFSELSAQGYNDMATAMDQANGVTANAATKQQGYNTALENAKGSVEALQITIGSYLLPVLTDLLNTVVAPGINQLTTFADVLGGNTEQFSALSPVLQSVAGFLQPVIAGFGAGGLAGALSAVVSQIDTVAPGFAAIVAAAQPLIGLIGANLQPILIGLAAVIGGAVVVAIGSAAASLAALAAPILAAVAVGVVLYNAWTTNFLGIQTITQAVIGAVSQVVQAGLAMIQAFWQQHGTEIMAWVQMTWATIQSIISVALQIISTVVGAILSFVAGFIHAHGAEIVAYLSASWNMISSVITTVLHLIQGLLHVVLALIQGDWKGAWGAVQQMSAQFVTDLLGIFKAGLGLLKAAFDLGLELVRSVLLSFVGDAKGIGASIINGIIDGVKSAVGGLVDAARSAVESAMHAAEAALGMGSPAAKLIPVGFSLPQGMALGITRGIPLVAQASTLMASSAVTGAGNISRDNYRTTNNHITYAPSYNAQPHPYGDVEMVRVLANIGI